MMRIVAIGGGSMAEGATLSIDRQVVKLSEKKNPKALFIPTASSDDPEYCNRFSAVYGKKLGCSTASLLLLKQPPSKKEIEGRIAAADIIYVGGGNTLMMMRRWRFLGVDKMLNNAARRGTVLCGTSAGAICWFQYGHSDSMFYYHPDHWNWIRVKCLGILPFTACPHCLKEGRMEHFKNMIFTKGDIGIALDDCTAIAVENDTFRMLHSKEEAKAFRVYKINGAVISEALPFNKQYQKLQLLGLER